MEWDKITEANTIKEEDEEKTNEKICPEQTIKQRTSRQTDRQRTVQTLRPL